MATDPGSQVYLGREGTGAATIFQPGINPLAAILQQNNLQSRREYEAMRLRQQRDLADEKALERFYANIDKPGQFQVEQSVKERDLIQQRGVDYAMKNPTVSVGQMKLQSMGDIAEYNRRNAKRKDVQAAIRSIDTSEEKNIDPEFIHDQVKRLWKSDIDEIDIGKVTGISNHPRAYNSNKGIVDVANDIKSQLLTSTDGSVKAGDYGLEYDNALKKYRFQVYPSGPRKGQIVDEVIEYVLDNDRINDRLRWDIAAEQVMGGPVDIKSLDDTEIQEINDRFEQIQFSNDPSVILPLYDKVRGSLDIMQQQEIRNKKSFRPYSSSDRSKQQNIPLRRTTVDKIVNVLAGGKPNQTGEQAIAELVGGKLSGYVIEEADPLLGEKKGAEWVKSYDQNIREKLKDNPELAEKLIEMKPDFVKGGQPVIHLKLKTTTLEGQPIYEDLYLDLKKQGINYVINTILNTVPGNNKVPNEILYQTGDEYLDEDDGGYLDE